MHKEKALWIICIILTFAIAISASGCNPSDSGKGIKKDNNSSTTTAESSETKPSDSSDIASNDSKTDSSVSDQNDEVDSDDEASSFSDVVTINNDQPPKCNNFMGLNAIYHCYTFMNDSLGRNYSERQAKIELDRIGQMGMKVVRTYYGPQYAWDSKSNRWNWESDDMKAFYRWTKELQNRNIDIALNAGWLLGTFTKGNMWDPGDGVFVNDDFNATYKNYSKWMVDSLKQLKAHGINNIKYLVMFTEPDEFPYTPSTDKNIWELKDPAFDGWLQLVKALDAGLKSENMRSNYKLVGPNSQFYTMTANGTSMKPMFYQAVMQANDYIDIFSCHEYIRLNGIVNDTTSDLTDLYWRDRVDFCKEKTGKQFWIDEFNIFDVSQPTGMQSITAISSELHALQLAVAMTSGMNMGIQNMMLWTVADQQWPNNTTYSSDSFINGVQKCGVLPSLFETSIPRVSYYGTSLLTKYFGFGNTYQTESDFVHSAYEQDNKGDCSILVTNMDYTDSASIEVHFKKNVGKKVLYRHLYDAYHQVVTAEAKLIGIDGAVQINGNGFTDSIPPNCFAVYTTSKY